MEKHSTTNKQIIAKYVIWTCSLLPDAVDDDKTIQTLARQLDPNKLDNRLYLGVLAFRSGKYLSAIDLISKEMESQKAASHQTPNSNVNAYGEFWLAMALARLGLSKQATDHMFRATDVVSIESRNMEGSADRTVAWTRRLMFELLEAEAKAVLAEGIDPTNPSDLRDRVLWYANQSNSGNSVPKTGPEWFNLAKRFCKLELWNEAEFALTEATRVAKAPHPTRYGYRSWVRRELGKFDQALGDAKRQIDIDAEYPWGYWDLGASHHAKGEWKEAVVPLTKFLSFNEEGSQRQLSFRIRAECYARLGQIEAALADLKAMNGAKADRVSLYLRLGNLLQSQKAWETAITAYTNGIEETGAAKLLIDRASTWCELKKYDAAVEDARLAIKTDPKDPDGQYIYGKALNGMQRWNEAIAAITEAIERQPDRPYYYCERGKSYFGLKQYDNANTDFEIALKLGSKTPELAKLLKEARSAIDSK